MTPASHSPLVVLLHGQPGAGVLWVPVVDALGPEVDALALDRPGYGLNTAQPGGYWTNVAWLARTLERERRDLVLVAHSWATAVAMGYALRRDERVRGMVLVTPVGPGAVNTVDRVLAAPIVGPVHAATGVVLARPLVHHLIARNISDRQTREELTATMRANHERSVWRSFVVEQRALLDELPAILDRAGDITVPARVVAGTRDRVTPLATAIALADSLPDAELLEVDGGGHRLLRTHPEVVARAVRSLFRG